jgi:hypothetical protein
MVGVGNEMWDEVRGDVVAIVTLLAHFRALDSVTLIGTTAIFNRVIRLKLLYFGTQGGADNVARFCA